MGQNEYLSNAETLHNLGGMDIRQKQDNIQTGIYWFYIWQNGIEKHDKG